MILVDLGDIWKVFGGILPLQNSTEKTRITNKKKKNVFLLFFVVFLLFDP